MLLEIILNEIGHVWTQYLHVVTDNVLLAQLMLNRIREAMTGPIDLNCFYYWKQ